MTARANGRARAGRRSVTDVLAGLAAVVVLLVLLAGVPLALITAFGLPVPHTMPSLSLLTHRLGLATVIKICSVVVWLAWLQLLWCVAAEVSAAVRNTGMPARVPLAGGMQALVHRLVTSALLLTTSAALTPALVPGPAAVVASAGLLPAPPAHTTAATAGRGTVAGAGGRAAAGGQPAARAAAGSGGVAHGTLAGAVPASRAPSPGEALVGGAPSPAAGDVAELLAAVSSAPGAGWHPDLVTGHRTEKIYVVEPPVGRFHESLWEIAERHLGDGRRYREIFELNDGRVQPDGSRLTIASLIRPGWVLVMPNDAHGPGIKVVTPGQHGNHEPGQPGHAGGHPGRHRAGHGQPGTDHDGNGRSGHGQAGHGRAGHGQAGHGQAGHGQAGHGGQGAGQHGAQSPGRHPGQPGSGGEHTPAAGPPGVTAPQPGGPPGQAASGPAGKAPQAPAPQHHASGLPWEELRFPAELAAAGFLAAGVLAALAKRRRRQRRNRAYGMQLPVPSPEAAWAEWALGVGADDDAAWLVDAGLCFLGEALRQQGRALPTVFAAHVGEENLDLWVAPASTDAPGPWLAVGDGQVWRLPLVSVPDLPLQDLDGARAPYPGLVTIGTDATGRVLVDVASARGLIGLTGPDALVRDVLTAMATELATSRWSEGIRLTLVGFGADLAVLAPERVRMVPTLAEALPALEAWAADVESVAGPPGPGTTSAGMAPETWDPHYLITALQPSSGWERDRLLAFARAGQAAGAACLAAGRVPGAAWTWEITPDGRLCAGQLGLDLAAQLIPHEQEVAVEGLFETAGDLAGVPLSAPLIDAAPAHHLAPEAQLPVEVSLLGPVSVQASGQIGPDRLALATEIVAYLATHPGGVHPNVLTAVIWPRGVTDDIRDAALDRVKDWLGTDGIGRPHLASDAAGRFRLGSGVRVDWQVFCTLVARAADEAPEPPGSAQGEAALPAGGADAAAQAEASLLEQALALVTGPFLADRGPGRYAWLAVDGLEYEVSARVADAAHRLCQLRLATGDPQGAIGAVRAGLRLAEDDELLWRDLITATHATGEEHRLRSVVGELCDRARVDDRMPGLAPQTEALIDELMPTWRWSVS